MRNAIENNDYKLITPTDNILSYAIQANKEIIAFDRIEYHPVMNGTPSFGTSTLLFYMNNRAIYSVSDISESSYIKLRDQMNRTEHDDSTLILK